MRTIKLKKWEVLDCWNCGKLVTVYYVRKRNRYKWKYTWAQCDICSKSYLAQKPNLKNFKIRKVVTKDE